MTLHPAAPRTPVEPPPVECEICGVSVPDAVKHSYVVIYANPGHSDIAAFQCPALQHFGCCEEHAWQATAACHEEHLKIIQQGLLALAAAGATL